MADTSAARCDPWSLTRDPGFLAWRADIEARHPRYPIPAPGVLQKAPPGGSTVALACVMAEEREGQLYFGARLSSGDEFWQPAAGSFTELVAREVASGYAPGWMPYAEWVQLHFGKLRLELSSSHVGSSASVVAEDGEWVVIDMS